jgi:hypothetical protein
MLHPAGVYTRIRAYTDATQQLEHIAETMNNTNGVPVTNKYPVTVTVTVTYSVTVTVTVTE